MILAGRLRTRDIAGLGGHLDVVDALLVAGATVNPPPGTHTPLRGAVNRGHAAIVARLLRAGADVNIPSAGNRTPLMGAAMFGHDDLLQTLLAAGADPAVRNTFGESAGDLAKSDRARALLRAALAGKSRQPGRLPAVDQARDDRSGPFVVLAD